MKWNKKCLSTYPPLAFLTPLPLIPFIPFTTEQMASCTNDATKGSNKAPRNPPP